MANLFDQFDTPEGNLFDQFDKAPVEAPAKPDPEDDTFWNRFGANIAEGLHSTPLAIAARTPKKPVYERDEKKRKEAETKYEQEKKAYKAQRVAEIMQYDKIPDWHKEENFGKRIAKLATTAAGQVAGGTLDPFNLIPVGKAGTALKTFLKGATPLAAYGGMVEHAMQTADIEMGVREDYDWDAIKASAAMAGVISGGSNVLSNHGSFKGTADTVTPGIQNLKDKPTGGETPKAPESTLPNIFDEFDTGPTLPERPAIEEPAMGYPYVEGVPPEQVATALPEPLPKITPEPGPIVTPDAPYIAPENNAPYPILQDYPQPYMDQLGPDVDARNTMNNPYIQNAVDLETAQAHPDPGAHSEMKMQVEPQDPIIGPDATRSFDDGVAQDIENKRFAPNLAERYGNTHADLDEGAAARAGYPELDEGASNAMRDIGAEDVPPTVAQWVNDKVMVGRPDTQKWPKTTREDLVSAGLTPEIFKRLFRPAELNDTMPGPGSPKKYGIFFNNQPYVLRNQSKSTPLKDFYKDVGATETLHTMPPEYHTRVKAAQSFGEVLGIVAEMHPNPSMRKVAGWLKDFAQETRVRLSDSTGHPLLADARALANTRVDGSRTVWLNVDKHGTDPNTIIHEAKHVATSFAHHVAQGPNAKLPGNKKYVKYHTEVKRLMEAFRKGYKNLSDDDFNKIRGQDHNEIEYGLTSPEEFDSQMSSVPIMRELAKRMEGRTLWNRMVDAWRSLFGVKPEDHSIFDRFVLNESHLPYLQGSQQARGEAAHPAWAKTDHKLIELSDNVPYAISPDTPAGDVARMADGKDLEGWIPQNVITPNQVGHISKNPLAGWFILKMGQIMRQAAPRFHDYKEALHPYMFDMSTKLDRGALIKSFKTLVDIQSPKLREARAQAEASNKRREFLQEHGLEGRELDFAITVLDIMKDIHTKDGEFIKRLGRDFSYEPMYFPRMHGGKFIVKVLDSNGVEQYVRGFDNYKDARIEEAKLRNGLADRTDMSVQKTERAEGNKFGDTLSLLLNENVIDLKTGEDGIFGFLKKPLKSMEKARETAPFSFEKKRRDTDVGGYVGEEILNKADEEALLKAMSWRLQASRNLETKTRMLTEIKFPLFDTGVIAEMPRMAMFLGDLINRELGVNISKLGIDKRLEQGWAAGANVVAAMDHFVTKYIRGRDTFDFRWEDPKVGHDALRELTRQWTYIVSQYKLGLNVPVLVTNFAQPTLLSLEGIRVAKYEGVNDGYAMAAQWDMLAYAGQPGPARDFMLQARREGMIEPHGQEHYTTAELPDRSRFDRIIQYPRDRIEESTNYASILYFYHFYKRARPDLEGEAFSAKVYQAARSFTGQYDSFATPLMFDKAGVPGQLFTNFSKWHFNQLGRLIHDVKSMGSERVFFPIIMTFMSAALMSGAYGLPIVVEYEAIRRIGMEFGWWDNLPPISAIGQHFSDDNWAWDMFERGALTTGSDALAKSLGAESGPDLSGSMRFAAFFDMPLVAVQMAWHVVGKQLPMGVKEFQSKVLGGPSTTGPKEIEEFMNTMPPALKGALKKGFKADLYEKKVKLKDGSTGFRILDPSEGRGMYTLSDVEDTYKLFGVRGKREVKALEAIYYDKWLERQNKKELENLTQGILGHPGDREVFQKNVKAMLEIGEGKAAIQNVLNQIKSRITASEFDYFTEEFKRLSKQKDGAKRAKMFERINKSRSLLE